MREAAFLALSLAVLSFGLSPAARSQETAFDPRDLSGVWSGFGGGGGAVPYGPDMPAMTEEGLARYLTNVPTRTEDPRLDPTENPALSNDPTFECNPRGFPRTMYDTNVRLFELIHLEDRVLQLLQRERTLREFWMDGRELPTAENMDNIGPAWYGHSVAHWEDDTLVVDTAGMDDRAWLDSVGHVKSFEARVEERYRRIDPDTIELRMTLYDPTYYSEPWEAETRIFKREPRERITYFGWYGIFNGVTDLMCAPMNAVERFREGAY